MRVLKNARLLVQRRYFLHNHSHSRLQIQKFSTNILDVTFNFSVASSVINNEIISNLFDGLF